MRKKQPEHLITLDHHKDGWIWQLSTAKNTIKLVSGKEESAEQAHHMACLASLWLSNLEDE